MNKNPVLSFICLLLVFLSAGCASKKDSSYQDRAAYQLTENYLRIEAELNVGRNDDSIYFGEGISEIGSDLSGAREQAKQNALKDLSSQIEIAVRSDLELIVSGDSSLTSAQVTDDVRQSIYSRTATYTSQILSNVKGNRQYIDYPMPGYKTFFVYIDKA